VTSYIVHNYLFVYGFIFQNFYKFIALLFYAIDTRVYLCDFHREQSWERWLGTAHNGQLQQKENALALFRAIARSSSEDELKLSKTNLEVNI